MWLSKIVSLVTVVFWPISLFLNNSMENFAIYILPSILIFASNYLHKRHNSMYLLPFLFIPFISVKLSLFPVLFLLMNFSIDKPPTNLRSKYSQTSPSMSLKQFNSSYELTLGVFLNSYKKSISKLILFLISLLVLLFNWHSFYGQTVLIPDYEAQQTVIRDTHLYKSVFMARLFHNKARVISDKYFTNFFALIDPNNYFFESAPRQFSGNQNLAKFPFPAIIFFIFSIFIIWKNDDGFMLASFLAGILSLSVLTVFDGNDFILWFPMCLILTYGIKLVSKINNSKYLLSIYLIFAFVQLLQIFISG